MDLERKLVEYGVHAKFDNVPRKAINLIKGVILNALGAIIAGANVQGCSEAIAQCKEWGNKEESTILIHGDRVPAHNAAFANSFMARAIGVDDLMVPGLHIGGSSIPTALAAAELVGGCNGKEFLTALIVGTEIAARINFATVYNGFDPTGVCAVFATAVIASRILGLDATKTWNALGHAFNMAGGSFQGTIDGSIAARVLQGNASRSGIMSAQLAQKGITGPVNFLEGIYGYFHLYADDKYDSEKILKGLGTRFELNKTFLKKFPSCGTTGSSIDIALELLEEKSIDPADVFRIKVIVTPVAYNLTGKPFEYGENPRISAMYSLQYCVSNALLRKGCKLSHFDEPRVRDPGIMELVEKTSVFSDPALDEKHPLAAKMEIIMKNGTICQKEVNFPRGVSENPLSSEELEDIFYDCVDYGGMSFHKDSVKKIISIVHNLEEVDDVRTLVALMANIGRT